MSWILLIEGRNPNNGMQWHNLKKKMHLGFFSLSKKVTLGLFLVSVLLSALVDIFSVSRMGDFSLNQHVTRLTLYRHRPAECFFPPKKWSQWYAFFYENIYLVYNFCCCFGTWNYVSMILWGKVNRMYMAIRIRWQRAVSK